jgi:hypothetical protein
MLDVVRSDQRYHFETDWLSTYWHFSFDHYYDPNNVSFGPLRVFNDDVVQPGGGFPTHSHREMEIVTMPLAGRLEHRDSTGGHGIISPGEVQRMSAGTGISHSEFNASQTEPVHLLQVWLLPAVRGLKPSYEQKAFQPEGKRGKLLAVASGEPRVAESNDVVRIHQDATFYLASLEPGQALTHALGAGRRAYLFVIEGGLRANGKEMNAGDYAKISEEKGLEFGAREAAEFLLIDLP